MDTNKKWSEVHPIGSKVQLGVSKQELEVLTEAFFVPGQHCVLLKSGDHQMVVPLEAIKGARELFSTNDPALATRGLEPASENHAGDGQPSGLPAAHGSASSESPET